MTFNPGRHHRRSIRLRGYDYTRAGAYFVTICVHDGEWLFGNVVDGDMRLSDAGRIVCDAWNELPTHYPHAELDAFVVMPNHVHGIVVLFDVTAGTVGAGLKPAPTNPDVHPGLPGETNRDVGPGLPDGQTIRDVHDDQTPVSIRRSPLSEIVRAFKTFSSRRINEMRNVSGVSVWQRNYYEHIIRNADALNRIRQYIADNPSHWDYDRNYPNAIFEEPIEAVL